MPGLITDLLTQATTNSRPVPTLVTSIRVGGGATLACNALTGWPTNTAVHFITYKIDTSGNKIAGSQIDMKGVVSGTNITGIVIKAGSDVGNAVGDIVEASPTAAWANDLVTWGTAHANQDGSLIGSAVRTALGQTAATGAGWTTLGVTLSGGICNGNRSYTFTTDTDQTAVVSPGMRLMTQRTVAAPTQATSLNGTTQFYNKTTPAGMTFTDDFVVSGWVRPTAYPGAGANATVASRYNGTSGFVVQMSATGQLFLYGFNAGAANFSAVNTNQSLPLNKWTHVTLQLDMSSFTNTATTSYIMFDAVDVPCTVTRGGTNPTALVQAGNLEIGSNNGGASPWSGKLAQVAIFNAKVTQATIRTLISQGLTGTETSLISAYSFNNSINDLNTTNANNLTANGSAVATNADSPFGNQANGTISSTLDYGIITAVTSSTITCQVPEGCTIPTSGGISAVSYSTQKSPFGFPGQRGKWQLFYVHRSLGSQASAVIGTWYNINLSQIGVPAGEWLALWSCEVGVTGASSGNTASRSTLSNANNTESDILATAGADGNAITQLITSLSRTSNISVAALTTYFFNTSPVAASGLITLYNNNSDSPLVITLEPAYL